LATPERNPRRTVVSSYLKQAPTPRSTPQSQAIPGSTQVANNAGGFAWELDSIDRLRRFLILGSEGGTYYVGERKLTAENVTALTDALSDHGVDAVKLIVDVSKNGRAVKNDPALFALAAAASFESEDVRRAAIAAIPDVARTGTHLFQFAEFVEMWRGWGRALKRGVASWYERDLPYIAYQAVKYRQREGWTHRDMLRLSHPKPADEAYDRLYKWIVSGYPTEGNSAPVALRPVEAFILAQQSQSPAQTAALIREFGGALPREALKPEHLPSPDVWAALLDAGMPMTALVRNLPTLTRVGVVAPLSAATQAVVKQLTDVERLRKARVHPLSLLVALATYRRGIGRGSTWVPVGEVVDALDAAFYAAFETVEPAGKRTLLAIDVSYSMDAPLSGVPLSCMEAAVAMSLVTERVEPWTAVMTFDTRSRQLAITSRQRLDDAMRSLPRDFGGTDCALPMTWALENKIEADTFVLYTDYETWAGSIHPSQALVRYREKMGIDARLVVVGMTSTGFSIADPNDAGMMDVVGFDTSAPNVISGFSARRF
jgi:60 kDa SS-A/Ro ribonucleoprotein